MRLLNKGFSVSLHRFQLKQAMRAIRSNREARRQNSTQIDKANGISDQALTNNMLMRVVENIGDTRLHAFFRAFVKEVDPGWNLALWRAGIKAMREIEERFEPTNVR